MLHIHCHCFLIVSITIANVVGVRILTNQGKSKQ